MVKLSELDTIPEVGSSVEYFGNEITLIDVRPYQRRDGRQSAILVWRRSDGVVGTSGLRSKSLNYGGLAEEYGEQADG